MACWLAEPAIGRMSGEPALVGATTEPASSEHEWT
jgi:hypothetical protein